MKTISQVISARNIAAKGNMVLPEVTKSVVAHVNVTDRSIEREVAGVVVKRTFVDVSFASQTGSDSWLLSDKQIEKVHTLCNKEGYATLNYVERIEGKTQYKKNLADGTSEIKFHEKSGIDPDFSSMRPSTDQEMTVSASLLLS